MVEPWAADVVAKLRLVGMTQKDFAKQCGYTAEYLSQILRGKKDTPKSKQVISDELNKLLLASNMQIAI